MTSALRTRLDFLPRSRREGVLVEDGPRRNRRAWLAGLILCLVVGPAGFGGATVRGEGIVDPEHDRLVGRVERTPVENALLPLDARFVDHTGREVELGSVLRSERPTVLALVYFSCPMICGMVTEGLRKSLVGLEWDLGEQYQVVFVSIDPRDTPQLAAARRELFLEQYGRDGAADGLHILTATSDAPVRRLADTIGYGYEWIEEQQQFGHTSAIYVITPNGHLAHYHGGWDYSSHDVKYSLMDAAEGKIGSVWDKINFLCLYQDPETGKWAPAARIVMGVGGGLTLGVLVMIVWIAHRSRRKRMNRLNPGTGNVVGVES